MTEKQRQKHLREREKKLRADVDEFRFQVAQNQSKPDQIRNFFQDITVRELGICLQSGLQLSVERMQEIDSLVHDFCREQKISIDELLCTELIYFEYLAHRAAEDIV